MNERLEQPTYPLHGQTKTEERARAEANILLEKINTGEAATYAEAEQLLSREEFQNKIERKAEERDQLRPKWKKWLGISKTNPRRIEMEQALLENERISSLVASGKFNSATEVIEHPYWEWPGTSSPKERDLEGREPSRVGELLGGSTGATFVELKDDGSAVYKPHERFEEKVRTKFINKERAAYLIDRFLGFNFVPPTVVRELNGKKGSLQEFVADAKVWCEAKQDEVSPSELVKLQLFDMLILNEDRNSSNYLVKDGRIHAIDHGLTLDLKGLNQPGGYVGKWMIPEELLIGLQRFSEWPQGQELLREALAELFEEKYADAIIKRIHLFLAAIDEQGNFSGGEFLKGLKESTVELCPT